MPLQFTVLASGSSGNAYLLRTPKLCLLIDFGMGPRQLKDRLRKANAHLGEIDAVLLTHTHSDHWHRDSLSAFRDQRARLYCHEAHAAFMAEQCDSIDELRKLERLHLYEASERFEIDDGTVVHAIPLSHDGGPTFGFRIEAAAQDAHPSWAIGVIADLGCWSAKLLEDLRELDLLALEFNHDVGMEKRSRRPAFLIERVLGDEGHLSNDQAADFLSALRKRPRCDRLRQVVQLHLSRQCNSPNLARRAAFHVVGSEVQVHTASQYEISPNFDIILDAKVVPSCKLAESEAAALSQAWLPGFETVIGE